MAAKEATLASPRFPLVLSHSKKAEQMRALARQAGAEVCGEEILSLSVGRSLYPEDGKDAEQLRSEADRRMYLEKQKQLSYKDRRLHPRLKCRVTIELRTEAGEAPEFANLTDISMGDCYIETSTILSPGSKINFGFSMDDPSLSAEGVVARLDPGSGVAVQFREMNRDGRACSGFWSSCRKPLRSTTTATSKTC